MVGHPPGLEWFCADHIEIAKRFSKWHCGDALKAIRAGAKYPTPLLRLANESDHEPIQALIEESLYGLSLHHYSSEQIKKALKGAFGLDRQLIEDLSYFVVEDQGKLVACGGWSYRKTLFGNDHEADRDAGVLDPSNDAAKIRAFFVAPEYARQGLATQILEASEKAAAEAGFSRFELMSTLPGIAFYSKMGYIAGESVEYDLGEKLSITFVPMTKDI